VKRATAGVTEATGLMVAFAIQFLIIAGVKEVALYRVTDQSSVAASLFSGHDFPPDGKFSALK
jgi:hypothetical protein